MIASATSVGPGKQAPGAPPSPVDAGVGAAPPGPTHSWQFIDLAGYPCSLCVQWRCVVCKQPDCPEDCPEWPQPQEYEPYMPDGSVPPWIYRGLHDECAEAMHAYTAEHANDPDHR